MKNKVLLIGNGINNIEQEYTWNNLIDDLIESTGAAGQIDKENKPFPLLYEQIYADAIKKRNYTESEIKKIIARIMLKLEPNEIHKEIINLRCSDILTTNYDFTLEKLLTDDIHSLSNSSEVVQEKKYSLFRHYNVNNLNIWHINGDAKTPNSIALGFEHYSGHIQKMRDYVENEASYENRKFEALKEKLKTGNIEYFSWLDHFFTKDIYILGLALDFFEIHLWWLFTYRYRAKTEEKIPITNKIVYFYPSPYINKERKREKTNLYETLKSRINLMDSIDIQPYSVKYDEIEKHKYYKSIIEIIKNDK